MVVCSSSLRLSCSVSFASAQVACRAITVKGKKACQWKSDKCIEKAGAQCKLAKNTTSCAEIKDSEGVEACEWIEKKNTTENTVTTTGVCSKKGNNSTETCLAFNGGGTVDTPRVSRRDSLLVLCINQSI